MFIIPHPKFFLKALPAHLRRQALRELRVIAGSGQHLNRQSLLAAWFRQTRVPEVRAMLERAFREVGSGA